MTTKKQEYDIKKVQKQMAAEMLLFNKIVNALDRLPYRIICFLCTCMKSLYDGCASEPQRAAIIRNMIQEQVGLLLLAIEPEEVKA